MVAKPRLLKDTGEELSIPPVTLEEEKSKSDNTEVTIGINLPFQGVTPGKYSLIIETTEATSSKTAVVKTDVEFLKN